MNTRARQVLAITAGTTFLGFLDVTIVNLAFPDLRHDFSSASLTGLSWVITAYAILFAADRPARQPAPAPTRRMIKTELMTATT
jgi:hypothetical protein